MEYFEDGRLELYNLREDIGETRNLASQYPERARELRERMIAWRTEIGAPMPTPHTPVSTDNADAGKVKKGKGKKRRANR